MFTGIIESVCKVKDFRRVGENAEITISYKPADKGFEIGESIAVDGVCLTVKSFSHEGFSADISPETLSLTTLSEKRTGSWVNIERALAFGGRVGGHFVSGHIDGKGFIKFYDLTANGGIIKIETDKKLLNEMVKKGSVAVDGISLTIAELDENSFSVAVIPHTFENTILQYKGIGEAVNIETDMLGKYVRRAIAEYKLSDKRDTISFELLKNAGFTD